MTNDLRVSVSVGLTLKIYPDDPKSYDMMRPEIRLDGIDPSGDVEFQVTSGLEAAAVAVAKIDEQMDLTINHLLAAETGRPGIRENVEALVAKQARMTKILNDVVVRLRDGTTGEVLAAEIAKLGTDNASEESGSK